MNGKLTIFGLIIITNLLTIIFALEFLATGFFEPNDVFWVLGGIIGLLGFVLLFWQYMLGIRPIVTKFTSDLLWINKQHQRFGKYGFIMIIFHPILLWLAFSDGRYDLLAFKFATEYDRNIFLGKTAITVLSFLWFTSALLRSKINYRLWKFLHFVAYIILPLVFVHSMGVGTFFGSHSLKIYFNILFVIFTLATIYRLLFQLGILKYKYKIVSISHLTHNTVQISLKPLNNAIIPENGQFIYIQINALSENHPFTVSHFDEQTKALSITPKDSGPFSKKLHNLKEGMIVFLDGPYGVFTREAYSTQNPIVLLAGGIGITPFMRLIESIKSDSRFPKVTLFYGNQTEEDIAFRSEIEKFEKENANFKVVNVLSGKPGAGVVISNPAFEKGYITAELLKKYLGDDFTKYDFFLCGPPVMVNKLLPVLKDNGAKRVYAERFSL